MSYIFFDALPANFFTFAHSGTKVSPLKQDALLAQIDPCRGQGN